MDNKAEIILMNISGADKAGITSSLTEILGHYNANILDIGQSNIHNILTLGILFEVPPKTESGAILKDLLFKAYEQGVQTKFTPVSAEDYENWVSLQGKTRYILTLLGRKLTARQISLVTHELSRRGLNIDSITRLTGRIPLRPVNNSYPKACVQMSVRGLLKDKMELTAKFMDISHTEGVDISIQEDSIFRRNRRLVCFDMDSTLIQTEVIDELADRAGVSDKVRSITEKAMQGEINFNESFIERVALLKGLDESVMKDIAENLPITEGAERLIKTLKLFGFKTAILSGGFTYFGNHLKQKLGIDYVYANELEIINGKLTGKHKGIIIDGDKKAELMKTITMVEGIHPQQVIAIGDGANDLPMLNQAGLGIAFHAKAKVKENAEQSISTIGLDAVLYLLGYRDTELDLIGHN